MQALLFSPTFGFGFRQMMIKADVGYQNLQLARNNKKVSSYAQPIPAFCQGEMVVLRY